MEILTVSFIKDLIDVKYLVQRLVSSLACVSQLTWSSDKLHFATEVLVGPLSSGVWKSPLGSTLSPRAPRGTALTWQSLCARVPSHSVLSLV